MSVSSVAGGAGVQGACLEDKWAGRYVGCTLTVTGCGGAKGKAISTL